MLERFIANSPAVVPNRAAVRAYFGVFSPDCPVTLVVDRRLSASGEHVGQAFEPDGNVHSSVPTGLWTKEIAAKGQFDSLLRRRTCVRLESPTYLSRRRGAIR
jgi:hypothetical protein